MTASLANQTLVIATHNPGKLREIVELIEPFGVTIALCQVNLEDLSAYRGVRQIDEENLVESTLSQQLRREGVNVVRRGDKEHRLFVLLHPGETRCQPSPREPAVA